MTDKILCPNCGKQIEVTEALKKLAKEEFSFELKKVSLEAAEEKDRRKKLEEELLALTTQLRKLGQEKDQLRIEMEKKLAVDEEKMRLEIKKEALEENSLEIKKKEKELDDMRKQIAELKLQQGSQQLQGEVLELEIEEVLIKEFPNDEIKPVPKGVRGADVIQIVHDKNGRSCGTILWESKNAKWTDSWLAKLREDQRLVTADIAVLVSVNLPSNINSGFSYKEGIWITNRTSFVSLASALRINLYQIFTTKLSAVGKNEKMEILYQYLTGIEFKQRVEAIVEAFTNLQDELEKEKRFFMTKWSRQEKEIRKVIDHTHGMHGDLQGIIGQALPEIKSLEANNDNVN
ncbi:MAG: DUF2130 domain-containing protein [Patescibacteria group bacterium]